MSELKGLMAIGGIGRLVTRASVGRPHRFHDALLAVELAAPVVVETLAHRGASSLTAAQRTGTPARIRP